MYTITLILLGDPKWGRFSELRPIYQGCRALTFALARLSCYYYYYYYLPEGCLYDNIQ